MWQHLLAIDLTFLKLVFAWIIYGLARWGEGGVYCTHLVVAFCVIGIDAGAAEAGEQN